MRVRELLSLISDGSVHVVIIDNNTGEVVLSTIWHNEIPDVQLDRKIVHIAVKEYELDLMVY